MIAPVLVVVVVMVALSAWSSRHGRAKLLARLRAEWSRPHPRARDMEAIADFFLSHPPPASLDEHLG